MALIIKAFKEEKWARNFLASGQMFFGSTRLYNEIENDVRQDIFDGKIISTIPIHEKINNFTIDNRFSITVDGEELAIVGEVIKNTDPEAIMHGYVCVEKTLKEQFAYCIYLMKDNVLSEENLNAISDFGDYFVIIYNFQRFMDMLQDKIKKSRGIQLFKAKNIEYVKTVDINKSNFEIGLFQKRDIYKNECEHRFVIIENKEEPKKGYKSLQKPPGIIISIGNLSNVAIKCNRNTLLSYIIYLQKIQGFDTFKLENDYFFSKAATDD